MEEKFKTELKSRLKGELKFNEALSKHTYFRIGGAAELLIIPANIEDLEQALAYLRSNKLEYRVIGNGSNLLVADEGFAGAIIKLAGTLDEIKIEGNRIWAEAGAKLPVVAKQAAQAGLEGLEFGIGIPATVGGATVMNAGLGNLESLGQLIKSVELISPTGTKERLAQTDCDFSYRNSRFQKDNSIISGVELGLNSGNQEHIEAKMRELISKRKSSQPLGVANAGCIFKNPEQGSAGKLIDEAGAKGLQIGGARVSEKHANFIVNSGGARARDVLDLIVKVRELVERKHGILLELEIEFLCSGR